MAYKCSIGIFTSLLTTALSPIYAAVILPPPSPYMPRATANLQVGHGWQDDADILFPLIGDCEHLIYFDGSWAGASDYSGGDLGLGYRQWVPNNHVIYGAYAFWERYKTDHSSFFSQALVGFEMLGSEWDGRLNTYWPIGDKQHVIQTFDPTNYHFRGHKLLGTQFFTNEVVEAGLDAEVGHIIPLFTQGDSTLRAYLGFYHFGFNTDAEDVNGGRIRAEYRHNNYVTFTASESYDHLQGNEFVIGVRLTGGTQIIQDAASLEYRMTEYITRKRILTGKRHYSQPFVSPENFYFVNNTGAPGVNTMMAPMSSGDGTFEHPYTTVQPAEFDATNDGNKYTNYVYIYRGGGSSYDLGGRLKIGSEQIFMGSGTDLIYRGVNVLSASGTPTLIGGLSISNNNVLSSFNLNGMDTGINAGIVGNGVSNILIQNIHISNYTGNDGADGINGADGTDGAVPTDGTAGSNGGNGQSAYGIHLTHSANILVRNVSVTNITGGNGGVGGNGGNGGNSNNVTNGGANGGAGGDGGDGGGAFGIAIQGSLNVALQNVRITNLIGGNGNAGGNGGNGGDAAAFPENPAQPGGQAANGGNGGDAGDAIGIQFLGTPVAVLNHIIIQNLTAGLAAIGGDGGDGGDAGGDFNEGTPTPQPGGDGGNGGNGGNGGDAIGIERNGTIVSASNLSIHTLSASTGALGGSGGTGGSGIQGGANGSPGTDGATGTDGIAANTTA